MSCSNSRYPETQALYASFYYPTNLINGSIKVLVRKASFIRLIAKWQHLLAEFDIIYLTQKAIKGQAIADHLADKTVEDHEPITSSFPDESIMVNDS